MSDKSKSLDVEAFYQEHLKECWDVDVENEDEKVDAVFDRYVNKAAELDIELSEQEEDLLYEKVFAGVF